MTPDHYATLGLHRHCTQDDIRAAYRSLVKQHHPDLQPSASKTSYAIHAINQAYAILSDPILRRDYDQSLPPIPSPATSRPSIPRLQQDVPLTPRNFIEGIELDIHVRDPGHPQGHETYRLIVPPETAPGTRFTFTRHPPLDTAKLILRLKARPDAYFKIKGFDLRCDLRINARRAATGGRERVRGPTGNLHDLDLPPNLPRNTVLRVPGAGLPRPRGGRGDLLVRVTYRPDITVTRPSPPMECESLISLSSSLLEAKIPPNIQPPHHPTS